MQVWAVANQKGGVGKTTSVACLAGLLAEQNQRVLLIDLDPQGSLTAYFGYNPDELENSIHNLFTQGPRRLSPELPKHLLLPTPSQHVHLLPASTSLATLERSSAGQEGMGLVLSKTLALLSQDFDYALIDTPPILGVLLVNALAAAQRLLLPVQTEFLAIKGLERMTRTLAMVMQSTQRRVPFLVLPTLYDKRTQASQKSLAFLRRTYPENAWRFYVPVDTRFRDASAAGQFPSTLAPQSRGVRAYRVLLKELCAEQVMAVS